MRRAAMVRAGAVRAGAVRAAVLILATVAPQVLGCGIFSPRDPRPGGGPGVLCVTPNTPDNVVSNILAHYASLGGVTCYSSMLDASFAFHPDAADSLDPAADTLYAHWTQAIESRVATELAANATFHMTVFDSTYATTVISPGPPRTELRFYAYHLIVRAPPPVAPDTLFQGRAEITFTQGSDAQWHITNWQDRRDSSGARTWGYLRRLYRVGF